MADGRLHRRKHDQPDDHHHHPGGDHHRQAPAWVALRGAVRGALGVPQPVANSRTITPAATRAPRSLASARRRGLAWAVRLSASGTSPKANSAYTRRSHSLGRRPPASSASPPAIVIASRIATAPAPAAAT